jgi:hypothetical protein
MRHAAQHPVRSEIDGMLVPPLSASTPSNSEIPVSDKWPRAWRLLFMIGGSLAVWVALIALIRLA